MRVGETTTYCAYRWWLNVSSLQTHSSAPIMQLLEFTALQFQAPGP